MKDFSKTHLTFLVFFLIVGLAGGYFWYWSIGDLEEKTLARAALQEQISQVDRKGLPPTAAVLAKLEENQKEFVRISEKGIEELNQNIGLFDSLAPKQEQGKSPGGVPSDAWKKEMNERRISLDKLAAKNKVEVKKDFFYGFSKFRIASPPEANTGFLGIQLLGINEISTILIDSKVKSYPSIKRVYFDDPSNKSGNAPVAATDDDESLAASILTGPLNLYRVYPFEVAIVCSTAELRDVVNRLNQSKYFFIIRFMAVENENMNVKSRSAIQSEKLADAKSKNLLTVTVAGSEMLRVRIRIDMLVWSKQMIAPKGPETKGAAK